MTNLTSQYIRSKDQVKISDSLLDSIKILSDLTLKDIEKSCGIGSTQKIEVYHSNLMKDF